MPSVCWWEQNVRMIHYIVSPEHFCCRSRGGVLPVKLKHADGATVNLSILLFAFYHGSVIERFNHVLVCRVSCITSLYNLYVL